MEIVLASSNKGKIAELSAMLAPLEIAVRSPKDFPGWPEVEETGKTFAENAVLKADAGCRFTGLSTVADDSGLVVEELDGAPGVFSARFAGLQANPHDNNCLLLKKLENVPSERRRAKFVCALAYKIPGREARIFSGETYGRILTAPRGNEGFGYDPLFFSDDLQCSFAEAGAEAKNRVSHRGRALQQLIEYLGSIGDKK